MIKSTSTVIPTRPRVEADKPKILLGACGD